MTLAVTLTVEQLRAIVREELKEAIRELEAAEPTAPISEERRARVRKRVADLYAGRR